MGSNPGLADLEQDTIIASHGALSRIGPVYYIIKVMYVSGSHSKRPGFL